MADRESYLTAKAALLQQVESACGEMNRAADALDAHASVKGAADSDTDTNELMERAQALRLGATLLSMQATRFGEVATTKRLVASARSLLTDTGRIAAGLVMGATAITAAVGFLDQAEESANVCVLFEHSATAQDVPRTPATKELIKAHITLREAVILALSSENSFALPRQAQELATTSTPLQVALSVNDLWDIIFLIENGFDPEHSGRIESAVYNYLSLRGVTRPE